MILCLCPQVLQRLTLCAAVAVQTAVFESRAAPGSWQGSEQKRLRKPGGQNSV